MSAGASTREVLDEVGEVGVVLLADRRVERQRVERDAQDLADPVGRRGAALGQLVDRRLALELLMHLALDAQHLVHGLDHVHRDADGARLVGDRAGDGLADPPRGVRRELEALGVVELLDRTHQAEVALLDEVEEQHAATDVALGDATTSRRLAWISSLLAR